MKKGGQFYIIAAVIIAIVLIGIYTAKNYVSTNKEVQSFYDIGEDLNLESGKVIDYGIYNSQNIQEKVQNFTQQYIDYADNKVDAGKWIFIYGNDVEITLLTYSKVSAGDIGITIGGHTTSIRIDTTLVTHEPIEREGNKIKVKAFDVYYDFDLSQGNNFYFLIGSGGEYVERN